MAALVLRFALALIFVLAALHKLRDRRHFDGIVLDYRLAPPRMALRVARLLPALELGVALGLLAAFAPAAAAAAVLFVAYGIAMTINLLRGRRLIDCGCGGAPQRLGGWLVARNVLLAVAALVLLLPPGARLGMLDAVTVAAAAVAALLLQGIFAFTAAHAYGRRSRLRRRE